MDFEEWFERWEGIQQSGRLSYDIRQGAEEAWDFQQARIEAALEVYAGMEGFVPETAPEAYCLRIIEQMAKALLEQEGGK